MNFRTFLENWIIPRTGRKKRNEIKVRSLIFILLLHKPFLTSKNITKFFCSEKESSTVLFRDTDLADQEVISKALTSICDEHLVTAYRQKKFKVENRDQEVTKEVDIQKYIQEVRKGKASWFLPEVSELSVHKKLLAKDRHIIAYEFNFKNIFLFFTISLKSNFKSYSYENICGGIRFIRKYFPLYYNDPKELSNSRIAMFSEFSTYKRFDYYSIINHINFLLEIVDSYVKSLEILKKKKTDSKVIIIPHKNYSIKYIKNLPKIAWWINTIKISDKGDKTLHLKQGTIYNVGFLNSLEKKLDKVINKDVNKEKLVSDYYKMNANILLSISKDIVTNLVEEKIKA